MNSIFIDHYTKSKGKHHCYLRKPASGLECVLYTYALIFFLIGQILESGLHEIQLPFLNVSGFPENMITVYS